MTLEKQNNNTGLHSHKRLSVQISLTGHSFLISHTSSKEVLFFSETTFDQITTPEALLTRISKEINNNAQLKDHFDEVRLIHCNDIVTTVPAPLFDEQKAAEYLKFNSKILATDFIAFDEVNTKDLITVYSPYTNINNFFFETFGSFSYFHATTKLLDLVLNNTIVNHSPRTHLHLFKDHFTCIITKNNQLQLCNSFTYKSPEDFIYYVLFCYEQIGLEPENDAITLSGAIRQDDALYNELYTYVRHLHFAENKKGVPVKESSGHEHLLISNL